MKKLTLLLLLLPFAAFGQKAFFLSPTGSDNNSGTMASPWFTLEKAWGSVAAGDTIYLRGGTFAYSNQQDLYNKNGTASSRINVWAYPGETPVITGATNYAFAIGVNTDLIYFEGSYVHFKGLEIAGFKQKPDRSPWFAFRSGYMQNCIVENINYHDNGAAFTIRGGGTGNLILNSDFYRNQDPYSETPYDGADGLAITFNTNTAAVNTIRGCRFYWNADDGCDLWQNEGYVLIENCWSFYNGYIPGTFTTAGNGSGLKLGIMTTGTSTVKRLIRNNVAYKNRSWGIVENNAPANMQIYNNTCINNGTWNYWFGSWGAGPKTFKNNISMGGSTMWDLFGYALGTDAIQSNNRWAALRSDFASLDSSQLLLSRNTDGSLPSIAFLTPAAGSPLINTGANVGIPYNGTAPDIGAFESGGQVIILPPPPNVNAAPVASAGRDQTITLPTSQVTLQGFGTDADGTIVSYVWSNAIGTKWNGQTQLMSVPVSGTYTYTLTVTDDKGATGTDQVTVTVLPAPPPPKTVLVNIWVYSDKTISTANRQNMNKTMVCRITVYSDGSIEKIK
jgi:PKD domain